MKNSAPALQSKASKATVAKAPALHLARTAGGRSAYLDSAAHESRRGNELSEPFTETRGRKTGEAYSFKARRIDQRHILEANAAEAFVRMRRAAKAAGIELKITSAFRTQAQQEALRAQKPSLAAKAGNSPHQRGAAVDLSVGGKGSATYRWLNANAAKFGFYETVKGEPWHWQRKE